MALPLRKPETIDQKRGWEVLASFEPINFSPAYLSALQNITNDSDCPGHSDVGVRNLLFSLILSLKPEAVLEVGGHIGSAALVMGEALRLNGFGKLFSIEPQPHYYKKIIQYVAQAQLTDQVTVINGFSYEDAVQKQLRSHAPFETIFLDACHDYKIVLDEIGFFAPMLSDNGVMVLHDTSEHAQSFDSTGQGGVRKALLDAAMLHTELKPVFFEYPLWLNQCGAALLIKQTIAEKKPTSSYFK